MQLPFRKNGRSPPNPPLDPTPEITSEDCPTSTDFKKDRLRPNTYPFTQSELPKTDSRSWHSTLRKPSFKSRSSSPLRTSKSVPVDLNKLSKDKPLPQTPRKRKMEMREQLARERMEKDQEEFLAGCAAAAERIEAMGGLMEYHEARIQEEKEEQWKRENPEKKFKWMRGKNGRL